MARSETLSQAFPCPRCSGRGTMMEYDYYQGGVCFKCGGSGVNAMAYSAAVADHKITALENREAVDAAEKAYWAQMDADYAAAAPPKEEGEDDWAYAFRCMLAA